MGPIRRRHWPLLILLAPGCGGSQAEPQAPPTRLECTIDGQQETRVMRDCSSDISYQERNLSARVEAFGVGAGGSSEVQFRPVQDSVMLLIEQQRSICRDWNACALARQEYVQRSEWLTSQFTTLTQILDAADPATLQDPAARERIVQQVLDWSQRARELQVHERIETERNRIAADEVAVRAQGNEVDAQATAIAGQSAIAETQQAGAQQRIASATEEQARIRQEQAVEQQRALAKQQQMMAQGNARVRAQIELQVEQLEREGAEIRSFLGLVDRIRSGSAGADQGKRPRVCGDRRTRSKLSELAVGGSSTGNDARWLREKVDDLCNRFEKWSQPDDRVRGSIARFFEHLDRIDGWMNDSIRCARMTDRAERRRCESSYGESRAGNEAAAQRAVGVLTGLRRELGGVKAGRRPFPCYSQTWTRIAAMQWSGGMARNWMPGLPGQAERVCAAIGVDRDGLGGATRQLTQRLDTVESRTRQNLRFKEDTLTRNRAMLQ